MSEILVNDYQRRIAELVQYGGSVNEDSIRKAFARLLDDVARPHDLRLIEELEVVTSKGTKVYPDGTLKDALRLTHGYWEAKDEHDDLDEEIAKKRAKGYPSDNILYEDSRQAVLIQNGHEVQRVSLIGEPKAIAHLLKAFVEFERAELGDFRRAIEQFKLDMPKVLEALRALIEEQQAGNKPFAKALKTFLTLCQSSINESVTPEDVREMLIQHILTEDIFLRVFGDSQFHRENNIARELTRVEETFFTGGVKKNTLKGLESYYGAIREAAAGIADHHEKQQFLKAIYENFYKVYNPKLADRLGVVYTPGELVRFMLDGVDTLLHRNFGKTLASKHVEILDPAVGTGTFITDLIEHLKAHPEALKHKYKNEIHCNEVAILPYYIANLNIEFTYSQLTKSYEEFPHICFVDTLDNLAFEQTHTGQQLGLLGSMSTENTDRIAKQNRKKISVVIGNPPYNANQANENDNNKNRLYEGVDKRIKETWIAASNAQKTKMYDMYARFFRWAADRVNSDGIIAFVTNRSFIDSRTFDGFRLEMAKEFDEAWIVDLGGDVRANPKLSGTTHNVFGIQTGVAISFWVKKHRDPKSKVKKDSAHVHYVRRPELETAADKLSWLSSSRFSEVSFEPITPDAKGNWINQADNDFDSLLPLASKETKQADSSAKERALFKLYSLGVSTNRDEWVYDDSAEMLANKMKWFISRYDRQKKSDEFDDGIKWSRNLKRKFEQGREEKFDELRARSSLYRPFVRRWLYDSALFVDEAGAKTETFPSSHSRSLGSDKQPNVAINVYGISSTWPLAALASSVISDLNLLKQGNGGTFVFPLYRYTSEGQRQDNLTDWGVKQFDKHYGKRAGCTRERIFAYVYAVLQHPAYRKKYALNLNRELPRVPFYGDSAGFNQWADWGERLLMLHTGFEAAETFALKRVDVSRGGEPKCKLKADKIAGRIEIDAETSLSGIPAIAWDYKLANRSALEWVLDQYKESMPRDPNIAEHFNTYHFSDYKERVIDLLMRVTTVSVETMRIVNAMPTCD
ncbi:MAG: type ISP restriction/modification enzyme [Pseudomonadota bacterium]